MNIYVSASLFAVLILIYFVISEFFTILFRFIGLPEEKARFQVTSLLTGTGFTTRESEMIISTRSRRRLAHITMLFGYVFNISIVSAIINVFLSLKTAQVGSFALGLLIPFGAVALIIAIMRIKPVRAFLNRIIEKAAGRIVRAGASNTIMLIDHIGKGSIAQITLNKVPEPLKEVPLYKTGLKEDKNILIMLVEHIDLSVEAPAANTVFVEGDKLTVFGDYKVLCRVFHAKERFA